jgi:hypothetical protein
MFGIKRRQHEIEELDRRITRQGRTIQALAEAINTLEARQNNHFQVINAAVADVLTQLRNRADGLTHPDAKSPPALPLTPAPAAASPPDLNALQAQRQTCDHAWERSSFKPGYADCPKCGAYTTDLSVLLPARFLPMEEENAQLMNAVFEQIQCQSATPFADARRKAAEIEAAEKLVNPPIEARESAAQPAAFFDMMREDQITEIQRRVAELPQDTQAQLEELAAQYTTPRPVQ